MLHTHEYLGDELHLPIQVIALKESETPYDFGESHRHNYFEIFFFQKGGGAHEIDFQTLPVEDLSVHIVANGKVHLLKRHPKSTGYILLFKRDALFDSQGNTSSDFMFLHACENLKLSENEYQWVVQMLETLANELTQKDELRNEMTSSLLHMIVLYLRRIALAQNLNQPELFSSQPIYHQFLGLLEASFQKETSASFYAESLNLSGPVFSKIIKKTSGRTPNEHIQQRRILEAKRLLTHSNLSQKEISYYLGFTDTAHFSNFFKTKTGVAPSDFF